MLTGLYFLPSSGVSSQKRFGIFCAWSSGLIRAWMAMWSKKVCHSSWYLVSLSEVCFKSSWSIPEASTNKKFFPAAWTAASWRFSSYIKKFSCGRRSVKCSANIGRALFLGWIVENSTPFSSSEKRRKPSRWCASFAVARDRINRRWT